MYPEIPLKRLGRLGLDSLALLWAAAWALVGWKVYQLVASVQVVADAIISAGNTFNSWVQAFRSVTPRNIPGLSSALSDLADTLQRSAGDKLIRDGSLAHTRINQLAIVLGVLIGLMPVAAIVGPYLLWRVRDAREIAAAAAFIRGVRTSGRIDEANAVLAHRAIALLPFRDLMRASEDPVRDLNDGHHDALATAMLRRAGMRPLRGPEEPQG